MLILHVKQIWCQMNQKEETYLQEGCVSLPIYCSSTGFCTFFFALICFSVLNAAETAPRVWFQGWLPNTCTKCTTELVWGVWVELRCLPRGGYLSNTGLDRQSDFNWPVQLLALVGSSWLYYVSGAYLSKSFLAQKSSLSKWSCGWGRSRGLSTNSGCSVSWGHLMPASSS